MNPIYEGLQSLFNPLRDVNISAVTQHILIITDSEISAKFLGGIYYPSESYAATLVGGIWGLCNALYFSFKVVLHVVWSRRATTYGNIQADILAGIGSAALVKTCISWYQKNIINPDMFQVWKHETHYWSHSISQKSYRHQNEKRMHLKLYGSFNDWKNIHNHQVPLNSQYYRIQKHPLLRERMVLRHQLTLSYDYVRLMDISSFPFQKELCTLPRKTWSSLQRARTGHDFLRTHTFKLGISDDPWCNYCMLNRDSRFFENYYHILNVCTSPRIMKGREILAQELRLISPEHPITVTYKNLLFQKSPSIDI